jgi:hypothetical protein
MASLSARALAVALLLAISAASAGAQELAGSFDQLRVLVRVGDAVRVTDSRGQEVRGSIADLSGSSLVLQAGGARRTFLEADIASIHQRRNDSLANGAKWGFAVGAGLGVLGGISIAREYEGGSGVSLIPILGLVYGAIGAGAGAGIDAMHASEQPIYAPHAMRKVVVRPVLTPDRKGVVASLSFGG